MKMTIKEALAILNVEVGQATPETIKAAYRRAAQKYHPDLNPAGGEMMKLINLAREVLEGYEGEVLESADYGEAINNALNVIMGLGLNIELCGSWVWVTGNTYLHKETLKAGGFYWSHKKTAWYFRPEESRSFNKSGEWSMEKIRTTYGTQSVYRDEQKKLAA